MQRVKMDNVSAPPSKKRKFMPQTERQINDSDFGEGSVTASPFLGLSEGLKVEVFEAGKFTRADAECKDQGASWPDALSEAQLDLLVRIKQLAMERLISAGETGLEEALPASALRTIGIIMDELVKDHVRKMASGHKYQKLISNKTSEETSMTQPSDHSTL
ncbi:hypothetical protein L7F22_034940 [Adiantum nelumboides]|nr:hypothetical protein [Adiantum nelumboides]MCO5581064.1 hypothetical protein [Adiantum nelumboides]